ncbi:MAG: hypothetical protein KGH57_03420 [Candidatus Micrarchaeota archaeon]|nr:hypothetical protein [Candidatus Micrarchaeota archaeon]
MVRQYYGDKPPEDEEEEARKKSSSIDIAGPISAWMLLLFVALAIRFITSSGSVSTQGLGGVLSSASNFILFSPGDIILPLVIGAAIGAEVGTRANSLKKAERAGALNGVYAAIVYIIGIVVIYEIISSVFPSLAPSFSFLLTSWIAIPVLVCTALSVAFAVLSYSRKVGS